MAVLAVGCIDLRQPGSVTVDAAVGDGGVEVDAPGELDAADPPDAAAPDGTGPGDSAGPPDGAADPPDGAGPDAPVLPGGMALHWRLDDADGAPAADDSGNGLAGTYVGLGGTSPRSSAEAAPVGFANPASRTFDGASRQAVVLATMPPALRPTSDLTLAAWYRATTLDPATGSGEVISGGNSYLLRVRASDIEISKRVVRAGGNVHVRCFIPATGHIDGTWHHVAAVITPSAVFLYLDGVLGCALSSTEPLGYDQDMSLCVGRHPFNENYDWNGQIDDVRIYPRALSMSEVAALATRAP
jgi:hypothetical protein